MQQNTLISTFVIVSIFLLSCGNNDQSNLPKDHPPIVIKKDKPNNKDNNPQNAPIINITDTVSVPVNVLCFKDSALNSERLSKKLTLIFGEKIGVLVKKNNLKITGPPMAWYKTQKAPFFFEAGMPIEKKAVKKLPKGAFIKHINKDSAVVAHYFGPYEETSQAYGVLKEWLNDHHKKQTSAPYEIYIGDPLDKEGKPVDPYKVQTDIVFPHN